VAYRRIKIGRLHNGLRVVTEGLAENERVVVSGLQRIRPGMKVNAKVVDMQVQRKEDREQKTENKGQQTADPPKPVGGK